QTGIEMAKQDADSDRGQYLYVEVGIERLAWGPGPRCGRHHDVLLSIRHRLLLVAKRQVARADLHSGLPIHTVAVVRWPVPTPPNRVSPIPLEPKRSMPLEPYRSKPGTFHL